MSDQVCIGQGHQRR